MRSWGVDKVIAIVDEKEYQSTKLKAPKVIIKQTPRYLSCRLITKKGALV